MPNPITGREPENRRRTGQAIRRICERVAAETAHSRNGLSEENSTHNVEKTSENTENQ